MNIHPLVVHFPIALLILYSIIEVCRFSFVQKNKFWFYAKLLLLIIGSIGAFFALQTGEIAEHTYGNTNQSIHQLIETHSLFATITAYIFIGLAIVYCIKWVESDYRTKSWFKSFIQFRFLRKLWNILYFIKRLIFRSYFLVPLAVIGIVSLTITGSLGGAIVYGSEVDPVVSFIYHLFF